MTVFLREVFMRFGKEFNLLFLLLYFFSGFIIISNYSFLTIDDAFISWRYGLSLVESGFWNYNPSNFELVEAYTNPIFAFLSIFPALFNIDVVLFFKLLAFFLYFSLIIFFVKRLSFAYALLADWQL